MSARTFTEQVPPAVRRYARRTARLKEAQADLGAAACGEPGAALADKLHMKTSPDTLLRLVRQMSEPASAPVHVLGIDDWAFRKGRRYGTILIDLERSRPIDLLPDRDSTTVTAWLKAHPGVEIVARDRASAYADAIAQGAPHAIQVADRWHLLRNLREAIEHLLDRHQALLRKMKIVSAPAPINSAKLTAKQIPAPPPKPFSEARRARRVQRYQEIKSLFASGMSQRAIARKLHLHRKTVRRYVLADQFPERAVRVAAPNPLIPFMDDLMQRWSEGCYSALQLFREIQHQGYRGSKDRVYTWTLEQRAHCTAPDAAQPAALTRTKSLSARRAAWLLVRVSSDLNVEEQDLLQQLLAQEPWLKDTYELAQRFGSMVRERRASELADWLQCVKTTNLNELKNFAIGLERDLSAVHAGLSFVASPRVRRLLIDFTKFAGEPHFSR